MNEKLLKYQLRAKLPEYRRRVEQSRRLTVASLSKCRLAYVSWSGGKDSTVMLHLIREIAPGIDVLYMRSGYALPDTTALIEQITQAWDPKLSILDAPIDYLELCQTFGLPHIRTKAQQSKVVHLLKKDRATAWATEHGFDGLFWGLRAEESIGRGKLCRLFPEGRRDSHSVLRIAPLAWWTGEDVWTYTYEHDLPYSHLYDHEDCGFTRESLRNTGWISTDGEARGQLEWLRRHYPAQFQKVRELL